MSEPLLLELKKKLSEKGKWVKLAETTETNEQTITVDNLNNYRTIVLQLTYVSNTNQVLATTLGTLEQFKSGAEWEVVYKEIETFNVRCKYINDTTVKLRTKSLYDRAVLFGII